MNKWFAGLIVGVVVLSIAWLAIYGLIVVTRYDDDPQCFQEEFDSPVVDSPTIDLKSPTEEIQLAFGQSRGSLSDQVLLEAPNSLPEKLAVAPSALASADRTIPVDKVHVRATGQRNRVLLDVCVDAREIPHLASGTYKGSIVFLDQRVVPTSVSMTMTVQPRYLYAIAPLILVVPFVALYVVWAAVAGDDKPKFEAGAIRTWVLAAGGAAVAYNAQGISKPGWTGGLSAVGSLIAGMYAASAAVAVSWAAPKKEPQKDLLERAKRTTEVESPGSTAPAPVPDQPRRPLRRRLE